MAEAVRGARRIGLQIDGERGLGYRLTGFFGYRWMHVNKALAWPPEPERSDHDELPGQQSLPDEGG